jgi:hypothetical protein
MRSRSSFVVVLGLIAALIFGATVSQNSLFAQSREDLIRLKAATFAPARGQRPAIPAALTISDYAAGEQGYYLVQFRGPIRQAWKDRVTALGGELLSYVPENTFKVRMTPELAARVQRLRDVAWVGPFQPAFKFDPDQIESGQALYRVKIERGVNGAIARAGVVAAGVQILDGPGSTLLIVADSAQVESVARVLDVAWIEPYVIPETHNEYSGGTIISAGVANARGYDGSTQIAAVADTGLGGGTPATAHRDLPASRVVAVNNWPGAAGGCFESVVDDGAIDVGSGHGTHVAGSVLSGGDPGGFGQGVAPAARLVFQATENYATVTFICTLLGGLSNGYYLTGLPDDLNALFQQAYDQGARVHANSWGANVDGDYNANSAETDQFIWNNPDMAITTSAGNDGADANNDGLVDNDSTGSPATAKNVLTVGASENDRAGNWQCDLNLTYTSRDAYQEGQTCQSMNGQNILGTAGQRWGFTTEPLNSDVTAGNVEQMAPFSSRGPTDDGRIKPDIVAPGAWVLSTYSDQYQEGYGDPVNPRNNAYQSDGWGMPRNSYYKYFGGTSMSNPIAAGGAVVLRDFYQKTDSHNASAALVKATLVNSAVDLLDENNDGANDNDFPIPNSHEGWGIIDLDNATDGTAQYVDNSGGLSTGASASYQYNVSAGAPLKVSLVWSDYPSTESAAKNLVNDLNLVVTTPGGATYRGNVFSGGWSQTGGSADDTNNVENVYIQSPAAGVWTVQVSAANVPNGPQPFALVVDGNFGGTAPTATPTNTPAPATATPTNTSVPPTVTSPPATATATNTPAPITATATNTPVPATATATNTPVPATVTATNTPVPATVTATNTPVPATVTPTPGAGTPPAAPSNLSGSAASGSQVNLTWTDNANNEDGFRIERCAGLFCSNFSEIATVGANATSYTDATGSPRTFYTYRVRAYNGAGNSAYSNTALVWTLR